MNKPTGPKFTLFVNDELSALLKVVEEKRAIYQKALNMTEKNFEGFTETPRYLLGQARDVAARHLKEAEQALGHYVYDVYEMLTHQDWE